jgi:glycosyltransferase involved in cell wall biosynthesis
MNPEFSVLQVGKFYAPYMGGIETHLEALARSLQRFAQVRVVVAANSRKKSEEVQDGVPVLRLATYASFKSAPICPGLVRELRRSTADIVHVHLPNPAAVLAWLAARPAGRLVVTYHSDTVRQRLLGAAFEPLVQRLLKRAAAILVTSPDYLATSCLTGSMWSALLPPIPSR